MMEHDAAWKPWSREHVVRRFLGAPFRWWISGGHALELWAKRSWRSHGDIDIGMLRADVQLAAAHLHDLALFVAANGQLTPLRDQVLSSDDHENNVWVRDLATGAWVLDLTLSDGDEYGWIYRRDRGLRLPWSSAVLHDSAGVPYLAPELQLLFKSPHPRAKDTHDAQEVLNSLDGERLSFLLQRLPASHPWRSLAASLGLHRAPYPGGLP